MNRRKPMALVWTARIGLYAGAAISLGVSEKTFAYDQDTHYYVTTMILADLGGGTNLSDQRLTAALANQYVDDNPNTLPTFNPLNPEQRRKFHFPASWKSSGRTTCTTMGCSVGFPTYEGTARNSPWAKHNVNYALKTNDPMLLGMALHTYMDSYSHEGYGAWVGHATAGHDPDRPHLATDKFREMVRMVYTIIQKWYKNNEQTAKPQTISLDKYKEWAGYKPNTDWCWDYDKCEITPRENEWKRHIKDSFPKFNLVGYYQMSGSKKQRFEGIAGGYDEPKDAGACLADEWRDREEGAIFNPLSTIAESDANAGGIAIDAKAVGADVKDRMKNWSTQRVVKYVLAHPDSILDRTVAGRVNTADGVAAMLDLGMRKSSYRYELMNFNADNWFGSWRDNNDAIATYLDAPSLGVRLTAASMLSHNAPSASICQRIDELYAGLDVDRMSRQKRALVFQTMSVNSEHIASCAPHSLTVLGKLLDHKDTSAGAAAALYLVGADEDREAEVSDFQRVNAMRSVRQTALTELRLGSQALKSANGMPSGIAKKAVESELGFWQARSYEDADDAVLASVSDQASLGELTALLKKARETGDGALASAAASALGTYEPADQPPQAAIDELGLAIADPNFKDVRVELGYALERLTGTMMNLDMLW